MRKLFLAAAAAMAFASFAGGAQAADKHMTVINETRSVMVEFYASRIGTDDWEEDILGVDTLGVGESVDIDFGANEECLYDVMGVFDDGERVTKARVNVCDGEAFHFTED